MNTTVIGRKPLEKVEGKPRTVEIGVPWDHGHPETPDSADADTTNSASNDFDKTGKGETISRMNRIHLAESAREVNEDHNVYNEQQGRDNRVVSQVRVELTITGMSSQEEQDKGRHACNARSRGWAGGK
jgi:hypothetical protein